MRRHVGVADPRGGHGVERGRQRGQHAVPAGAGAERGGRVAVRGALGRARARRRAPGGGRGARRRAVPALLLRRQPARLQGTYRRRTYPARFVSLLVTDDVKHFRSIFHLKYFDDPLTRSEVLPEYWK